MFYTILCAVVVALHVKHHTAIGSSFAFGFIVSTVSLLLVPVFLAICGVFIVYRIYVKKRLQKLPGFVEMMDGNDAYWTGDDASSRNIINVLFKIDFSNIIKDGQKPIDLMRETMKVVVEEASYKLKCKRRVSKYGYYYLEKYEVDFNETIRHIEPKLQGKADLDKFISKTANEPIVMDYFWEMLVGREELDGFIPLILRTQHGLGDGYSLVHLFIEHIYKDATVAANLKVGTSESKEHRLVEVKLVKIVAQVVRGVLDAFATYIVSTAMMAQFLVSSSDKNCLHNRVYLSGKKICRYTEMKVEYVKEIRRSLNVQFMDVLMTAVSDSLEGCFAKWGETVEKIQVVTTARRTVLAGEMNNYFTVAFPVIPIKGWDKMRQIRVEQVRTKNLTDLYAMYWILWVAFTIFPATMISKHLGSHVTLSVSNVPGPTKYMMVKGCPANNVIFFSPNRSTTGVGLSFMSYGDRYNIGITVDEAILSNPDQADQILEGIIQSFRRMHRNHVKSVKT